MSHAPVVVVTGASGNLGRAVALRFHFGGARVALLDRRPERLTELLPELVATADRCCALACDIGDTASVDAAFAAILERFGRVDTVVHAAGAWTGGDRIDTAPADAWDRMLAANATPVYRVSRAAAAILVRQGGGTILTVAARPGLPGAAAPGAAAYGAVKSAVVSLTTTLAAELGRYGVRVNGVVPGTIDTPENRAAMPGADRSRWASPEAIAEVLHWLASDAAAVVNGALLPVEGAGPAHSSGDGT